MMMDTNEKLTESAEPAEPSGEADTVAGQPPPTEPQIDWQDRCLRLAAEFDNYRKRTERQYAQIIKSAEEQLIGELTEVLDNLERALDPEHRNAKVEELAKGVELIYGQFRTVLEKRGLVRMNVLGEPFDPEKHEAVLQLESADIPEGRVALEVSPGYYLGDRVIRHAKVVVSRGPAKAAEPEPPPSTEES